MTIAVTGALGGVGRAVVDHVVSEGHTVVSIDRGPVDTGSATDVCVRVDLTDYAERALAGCHAVIHLAAINGPGRHRDHEVHNDNVVSSCSVLRAAAELGIERVCQASSVNAIGARCSRRPRYDDFPVDELPPADTDDPYSLSKWICEQQAEAIARRYGVTIAGVPVRGDSSGNRSCFDDRKARELLGWSHDAR